MFPEEAVDWKEEVFFVSVGNVYDSISNLSGNHSDRSMMHLADLTSANHVSLHFHCACGFVTQRLAYMLDSLVRVSRRAV